MFERGTDPLPPKSALVQSFICSSWLVNSQAVFMGIYFLNNQLAIANILGNRKAVRLKIMILFFWKFFYIDTIPSIIPNKSNLLKYHKFMWICHNNPTKHLTKHNIYVLLYTQKFSQHVYFMVNCGTMIFVVPHLNVLSIFVMSMLKFPYLNYLKNLTSQFSTFLKDL